MTKMMRRRTAIAGPLVALMMLVDDRPPPRKPVASFSDILADLGRARDDR